MNLDELRSVQSKERQKDSLQNLRPSFYQEVGEYIADLEDERDRVAEGADDPFSSPEVGRLTDEIETAKDVVEAIYERRMGKLVKQASLAAAGMPADDGGLTAEEADLFDDLVDRIGANKSRVLDVLEGVEHATADPDAAAESGPAHAGEPNDPRSAPTEPSPDQATAADVPPVPPEQPTAEADPAAEAAEGAETADSSGVSAADVMGGDGPPQPSGPPQEDETDGATADTAPEPDAGYDTHTGSAVAGSGDDTADTDADVSSESGPADVDRTTVRITSDIGSILGVDDREYTLTSDDVVTLPEQNAAPLVDREAAERLE